MLEGSYLLFGSNLQNVPRMFDCSGLDVPTASYEPFSHKMLLVKIAILSSKRNLGITWRALIGQIFDL